MPDNHQNANQTPAQQRQRRGPAFLLNNSSTRSSSSHQFASPPRFLLSQSTPRADGSSQFHRSAAFSPFGSAAPSGTPRRSSAVAPERIDDLAIEDDVSSQYSNDEIDEQDEDINEPGQDVDISSEMDDFFSPPRDSSKRRRISSPSSESRIYQPSRDDIQDSISSDFPPSPDPVEADSHTPASPLVHRGLNHREATFQTPAPARLKRMPEPRTPIVTAKNMNMRSSVKPSSAFHSPPRYIVSANYTPSVAPHASSPATVTAASALAYVRKKPVFVLPRSPSPDSENANLDASQPPTSFSPTLTQKLHRRGRSTSSGTYVPGGLAEQLRDWILEKGAERERITQRQVNRHNEGPSVSTARIDTCRKAYLKSSGPVAITRVTPIITEEKEELVEKQRFASDDPPQKDILLIGASTSHSLENDRHTATPSRHTHPESSDSRRSLGTNIKPGDIIRIRAGLTWEIELDDLNDSESKHEHKISTQRVIASSQSPSLDSEDEEENEELDKRHSSTEPVRKTWLVAAEWTRLS